MHRVINVSLNDNAFQIEESGYDALSVYLDRARAGLRNNPDIEEILTDIERAIGEKCAGLLKPGKTVLRSSEIARILAEMGPVVGDASAEAPHAVPGAGASSGIGSDPPRRLYKVREGKMIGGVCLGLAQYVGLEDVTIMRLIYVAFTLVTGIVIGVLFYILMMLVMPWSDGSKTPPLPNRRDTHRIALWALGGLAILLVLSGVFGALFMPFGFHMGGFGMAGMLVVLFRLAFWAAVLGIVAYVAVALVKNRNSHPR